ncbi:MAG: aminotransferase class I/II-fold pyridoxal phosphate-dependent enzyme [Rhodospirillaceae bacterium]|jgi:succinyldiaminopimelate transaminase|nr:aminotransferase class I/II-fold pyridoxal phosphate-dependent enzyme [Rhodospirillaceae bacterium]MBT4588270.1 aminotransferase class I/II-fold pyridoxal phosphate-dependent enzyme [Rhodospirillaceae bacterium]
MHNTNLEKLTDYPFDRLRALLNGIDAPADKTPMIMSLGEPQHPSPALLAETVNKHADQWAKYPPIAGTQDLLNAIKDWLDQRYQLPANSIDAGQNIVAVSGTREALYMAGDIAIPPQKNGQQPVVLIPNPFYQVYIGAAMMSRAEPVYMSATPENGFLPDFDALDEATLKRTALAFLCTPSNPQGAVADLDYLTKAIELARKYDFVLAVDECYAEIYDQLPPPGGLEACQSLGKGFKNVLVFHSLSKRSNAPGLRSGFVAGDPDLIQKFKTLRNYGGASLPIPILAASAALWRDNNHVEVNRKLYRQKFDRADQILTGRFDHYRPQGGFYLWLNVGDGEKAAFKLWQEAGVKVIPGAYLARPDAAGLNPGAHFIRIALVQEPEFISEALSLVVETLS